MPTVIGTFIPDDLLPTIALPSLYGIGLKTVFYEPDEQGEWQGAFVLLDVENVEPLEIPGCSGGISCEGGGPGLDIEEVLGCSDAGCGADGCGSDGCADAGCSDTSCNVHQEERFSPVGRWLLFGMVMVGLRLRRKR